MSGIAAPIVADVVRRSSACGIAGCGSATIATAMDQTERQKRLEDVFRRWRAVDREMEEAHEEDRQLERAGLPTKDRSDLERRFEEVRAEKRQIEAHENDEG